MGLDMYLRAEQYVSGWEHSPDDAKRVYATILDAVGLSAAATPDSPSATVSVTVAYWRKANQIHQWFVDNVQGGLDDCEPYYVSRDQLLELREACMRVLRATHLEDGPVCVGHALEGGVWKRMETPGKVILDPAVAEAELPTTPGFFFGSTDYDSWYVHGLLSTVDQIDRVLANTPDWQDFDYQSSW